MKNFICALCVLTITLILVILYSVKANSLFNEMFSQLEKMESDNSIIYNLCDTWLENKSFLELSLSHNDIDQFVMAMIDIRSFYECGDYSNFIKSVNLAKEALEHIAEHEELTFNSFL